MIRSIKEGRLSDLIQRVVAVSLERDLKDPSLRGVTITEVRTTGDLHLSRVFWICEGGKEERREALERAKGKLRSAVARRCTLKTVPHLEFCYDELQDNAEMLERKISEAAKEDERLKKGRLPCRFAGGENPYKC